MSAPRATARPRTSCFASSAAWTASSTSKSTASPHSTMGAARHVATHRGGVWGRRLRGRRIEPSLRLRTDLRLGFEGPRARAETSMRAGQRAFCALGWSEYPPPGTYDEADARLAETRAFWHDWISRGRFPDHPWQIHLQRSALTLKGLTYAPTGAMIAAATTSLPETPGGERNWDYRYSWLRDSTFMLWGLSTLGFDREATDYFYFIADRVEDQDLQIMYGIDGRAGSTRRRSIISPVTKAPARSGSATTPGTTASTTFGECSSTRFDSTRTQVIAWTIASGRCSRARSTRRWSTGVNPTAGSGRCAATRSTSRPPRCSAGSPPTAGRGSRAYVATRSGRALGSRRRGDSCRHLRARNRRPRRLRAALRHRRARRFAAAASPRRVPAFIRRTGARHRSGHRRRADGRRARSALPHGCDRRRVEW